MIVGTHNHMQSLIATPPIFPLKNVAVWYHEEATGLQRDIKKHGKYLLQKIYMIVRVRMRRQDNGKTRVDKQSEVWTK